ACAVRLVPPPRQPRHPATQAARPPESPLEQPRLEPAVEVLDAAIALRHPRGNEHRSDAEPQAQPNDPRQGPCRRPPAAQLAGIVELDLGGPAQVLPALPADANDL